MRSRRQVHVVGPKIGRSHTSTTRIGKQVAETAQELKEVGSIALCALRHQGKSGIKGICSYPENNGLRIRIKSGGTIQDIHIITNHPKSVLEVLTRKFAGLWQTG